MVKLFGITFGERKSGSSREEILQLLAGAQGGSKAGVAVNYKTAAAVGAAIGCARVIAEGLSQVPFKLFKESASGSRDPAKDHPLYKLMARKPNEWQTSFEFREMIALHMVFCGNAYVFVSRSGGKILELLPFQPQQVTVKRNGWQVAYEINTDKGERILVPAADMWHLRGPSWDGVVGLDIVKLAREAIGLALATEEHNSRMFSNGARVGGILSSESALKEDQVKTLRESWERTQGGVSNAFKTAILWGGLKWSSMAMDNDAAQMIEQRRFQVEEICRHFRVMPIMVGYSDKTATYASAEQMFLAHVVHTLGPWYSRIEQSAEANLLTEAERDAGYYFKFIASGLMRGAHADRAAYFSKALGAGGSPAWMTQDEVRGLEEMNPMGGAAAVLPIATNVPVPDPNAAKTTDALQ
ncbi:MAG: phage portal protein [Sulfuritalea sp.]|nr:phage portal protein [Sulfuritalea sp.]